MYVRIKKAFEKTVWWAYIQQVLSAHHLTGETKSLHGAYTIPEGRTTDVQIKYVILSYDFILEKKMKQGGKEV